MQHESRDVRKLYISPVRFICPFPASIYLPAAWLRDAPMYRVDASCPRLEITRHALVTTFSSVSCSLVL